MKELIKYNFGCGPTPKEGYINVDGFDWGERGIKIDEVQNLTKVPYAFAEDNSASEIIAIEVFEHISWKDAEKVLKEWYRILAYGGTLQIQVPDCGKAMEYYVNGEICECVSHKPKKEEDAKADPSCFVCSGKGKIHPNRWLFSFLGAQKHPFDAHLNIFTHQRMSDLFDKVGITNYSIENDSYGWKLIAKITK